MKRHLTLWYIYLRYIYMRGTYLQDISYNRNFVDLKIWKGIRLCGLRLHKYEWNVWRLRGGWPVFDLQGALQGRFTIDLADIFCLLVFFCKISCPSDFHCYTSSSHRHGHVNLSSIYNPLCLFINTDKLVLGHVESHVFNYVSNLCAINQAPTGLRRKTTVEV